MLELAGIKLLERMKKPMRMENAKEVLQEACNGKLHYLTDRQVAKMTSVHSEWHGASHEYRHLADLAYVFVTSGWGVFLAFVIGFVSSALPALIENILVWHLGTDGFFDAYFTCSQVSKKKWTMSFTAVPIYNC